MPQTLKNNVGFSFVLHTISQAPLTLLPSVPITTFSLIFPPFRSHHHLLPYLPSLPFPSPSSPLTFLPSVPITTSSLNLPSFRSHHHLFSIPPSLLFPSSPLPFLLFYSSSTPLPSLPSIPITTSSFNFPPFRSHHLLPYLLLPQSQSFIEDTHHTFHSFPFICLL